MFISNVIPSLLELTSHHHLSALLPLQTYQVVIKIYSRLIIEFSSLSFINNDKHPPPLFIYNIHKFGVLGFW